MCEVILNLVCLTLGTLNTSWLTSVTTTSHLEMEVPLVAAWFVHILESDKLNLQNLKKK